MNAQRMMVAATLLVVVALILSACGGGAAPTAAPQPTSPPAQPTAAPKVGVTYKIGFAPDATGGGAFLGEPEAKVGEILVARLKKDGVKGPDGVMHPIEVLVKDTESKPDTAVSVARRFVTEDKVVALIMGSTTALSVAVADVAEETKTPYISMASASAIIIDPKTTKMRPWVFKVAQSNSDVAVLQVERLQKLGVKKVSYLYENTGYGKDCFNSSKAALEKAGLQTVSSDPFERTDTQFPQLAALKAANPDVVVIGAIPPGAALATIAVRDALPNVPIIQGHGVCTQDFIKTGGKAVEGLELPCSMVIIAEDVPADNPQKAVFMDFKKAFEDATGRPVSTFGGHAWDSLLWVADALKSLPDGLSLEDQRQKVRDYFETKIVKWPGTAGVFTLTPDDHYGLTPASFAWFKIQNGKFVPFPKDKW